MVKILKQLEKFSREGKEKIQHSDVGGKLTSEKFLLGWESGANGEKECEDVRVILREVWHDQVRWTEPWVEGSAVSACTVQGRRGR